MAQKRAPLSFDALKNSKQAPAAAVQPEATPAPAVKAPTPKAATPKAADEPAEGRGRGRPAKRDPNAKTFGMTLRISSDMRRALRRLAEDETDERGHVVSIHDVILEAVQAHLTRKR